MFTSKEKNGKKLLVLLDAHAIIHRAYHALPDFSSSKGEPTGALYGLASMLMKIISDLKPDYLAACFDLPKPTYRHIAFEGYKATRKKADDELVGQLKRARDVFEAFRIPVYEAEGFEADDILGTIVENNKSNQYISIIIASGDSDTMQLVNDKRVQVFTLKKGINDTILYDEDAVTARFGFGPRFLPDYKGFAGDSSDNIPGIKGIGEKTATLLISKFGTVEEVYRALKKNPGALSKVGIPARAAALIKAGEEEALFSKMLGTIRRDAPVEFKFPATTWRQGAKAKEIETLFFELEFRSLQARARELLAPQTKDYSESGGHKSPLLDPPPEEIDIPETLVKETALALWVADSNITDSGLEEIYSFAHTRDFKKAREIILAELKKRGGEKVFTDIELPLMSVVETMNKHGVKINRRGLSGLSKEYHAELAAVEKKIIKAAGREFNVNSPKQLSEVLFGDLKLSAPRQKKTPTGALSTKESELEKLRGAHPIIADILFYRQLSKLLSTYIDVIPQLLDENDRLHATFIQSGTTTGRMASKNPNLQNIPIRTERGAKIREMFIAERGHSLVAFDYSQMELRIGAFLSADRALIDIFRSGEDVHASVAAHVFKVPLAKVDYEMRRRAKVINFGILYGMGVNALRQNLSAGGGEVSRAEAQNFYDDYFNTFNGLAVYLDEVKAKTARDGFSETHFGRRRYFSGINSRIPYVQAAAERMAINAPIQGTEADIVKIAMTRISSSLKKENLEDRVHLILQVHDELVYEIRDEAISRAVPEMKKIMEQVLPISETKRVPIIAEVSTGPNWGNLKMLAKNYHPV